MKINQLASKPQLVKIILDDKELVKEFGEPIEVWTWDRQPLEVFMKLANASQSTDAAAVVDIVKTLILDENGNQVMVDGNMLPTKVLLPLIQKIVETLGK